MNFLVRPSKIFLFDILEKNLKQIKHGIGIDAGSASMKNRRMFKTDVYYGIDIDLAGLQKGLKIYDSKNTFGILADLTNLKPLPLNSADVVVSTNTLYCLPIEKRIDAIKNLCGLTSPKGRLMCQLPNDAHFKKIMDIFHNNFQKVKIIYFRNYFSRFYEWIFAKEGFLGSHPVAGLKPFRLLAWLISRLEYLTCFFVFPNTQIFIIACKKKEGQKNEFKISEKNLENRIYNLTSCI